jgi:hypothetical protein
MSCRSVAAGSITACSGAAFTGYPVELLNAAGALAGCSAVDAQVGSKPVRLDIDFVVVNFVGRFYII